MTTTTAAVARADRELFCVEQLELAEPAATEVLVRFQASGLCHTDLEAAAGNLPTPRPVVLGHEGAGVVEAIGSAVTGFRPGDQVVTSLDLCGACGNCLKGMPAYCDHHAQLNFLAQREDGSTGYRDAAGKAVHDRFIGQSSLAGHGVLSTRALIKIDSGMAPAHLAPLGCGIVTGAGAVFNSLKVQAGSTLAVFGAGAVGLSAVMAAQVAGAARIIAVDPKPERRAIALDLGATDAVDPVATGSVEAVRELTAGRGVDHSVESSGVIDVMKAAVEVLAPLGSAAILGVTALDATFPVSAFELLKGRTVTGSVMGHQAPAVLIPRLLELHRRGRFPFERLIRTYPLSEINTAVEDIRRGSTVKAVLTH